MTWPIALLLLGEGFVIVGLLGTVYGQRQQLRQGDAAILRLSETARRGAELNRATMDGWNLTQHELELERRKSANLEVELVNLRALWTHPTRSHRPYGEC